MSENFEKLENVESSENAAPVENVEAVEVVSQETFENADKPAQTGKKAKKPLSKKGKIAIIAGVSVLVVILTVIITLVAILLKDSGPSGAVDSSVVAIEPKTLIVGASSAADIVLDDAFTGKTGFAVSDAAMATIADKTIGEVTKKVMTVTATTGTFNLTFTGADGKSGTVPVTINDGTNVSNITEFDEAIKAKAAKINILADITPLVAEKAADQRGYTLENTVICGNGFVFDATAISARRFNDKGKEIYGGTVVFTIAPGGTGVVVQDLHIIGEKIVLEEGKTLSLDEFESNGNIFSVYGDDKNRASFTLDHCIIENGQKHIFVNSADVTIKNSLLRNGADAIIAVETNTRSGAILTVENNIISNSVVAGILFCGWTNVGADAKTTCKLIVKGYLDIYNWKDSKTTKLVPASEGWMAAAVNKMVGSQIKQLTKDPKAVKEYMVKLGNEYYVHIGIIILATGAFKANKTIVEGIDIADGKDAVGYVKRGFPIPQFASAIAKTCELIGYNQETAGKKTAITPKSTYSDSQNFKDLGFTVVK